MTIRSFKGEFEFLSNFYPSEVEFEGKTYATVEHAYQAAKSTSNTERDRIRKCTTPGKAKRLGQKFDLRKDWESIKIDVMRTLLRKKFSIPELKDALLATQNVQLIEGNWWNDTFWGVCNGRGTNHLGRLLERLEANSEEVEMRHRTSCKCFYCRQEQDSLLRKIWRIFS